MIFKRLKSYLDLLDQNVLVNNSVRLRIWPAKSRAVTR